MASQIGRRIYFDKESGNILVNTGEHIGILQESTFERDIEVYKELSEKNRDTFDVIELEFGQYAKDFAECIDYRVNPETKQLEFSYPDPNNPEAPQVFRKPLSEAVNANTDYLVDVDYRLTILELGI